MTYERWLLACVVGGPATGWLTHSSRAPLRAWFLLSSLHPHLPPAMMVASRPQTSLFRRSHKNLSWCLVDLDRGAGVCFEQAAVAGDGVMLSSSAWCQLCWSTRLGAGVQKLQLELGRHLGEDVMEEEWQPCCPHALRAEVTGFPS